MTDQERIDDLLNKLRERIPGLEWSGVGEMVYGTVASKRRGRSTLMCFRLHTYRCGYRTFVSDWWSDEPKDTDDLIDRAVEWLQDRRDEYVRATEGAL